MKFEIGKQYILEGNTNVEEHRIGDIFTITGIEDSIVDYKLERTGELSYFTKDSDYYNYMLKPYIKSNMKQEFTVEGSDILTEAFKKQLISEGITESICISQYITPSREEKMMFTGSQTKRSIHYILPQQWEEALHAFRDYYKEEYEIGDWVYVQHDEYNKDVFIARVCRKMDENNYMWVDSHIIEGTYKNTKELCVAIPHHIRKKATEEEVCEYLAEIAGLKIGMKGIFQRREYYKPHFSKNAIYREFSDHYNASIQSFKFYNNVACAIITFDNNRNFEYLFPIQQFIDSPIKLEEVVMTLTCDSEEFQLSVSKEGIYYEPESSWLPIEQLRSFIREVASFRNIGQYSFQVHRFDAGCKKGCNLREWIQVLAKYDEFQKD